MTLRAFSMGWSRVTGIVLAATSLAAAVACGSPSTPASTSSPAPAATSAPAQTAAPATPATLTILEPGDGTSSGHISVFRWSAVEGADGYRMRLTAATDGRLIWESPVVTTTDTHLPATVALEPEAYVWQVTALRQSASLVTSSQSRFTVTP